MQRAFDMTVEWAFDRYTFGRPLASYQELKHRFADMKSWLEAAHAISDAAAAAVQDATPDARELVSVAKAFIGHYGTELLQDCVQMHGGIGVTFEHDLHLFLRRVTVDRALFGTPADHRQRIATIVEEGWALVTDVRVDRRRRGVPAAGTVVDRRQPRAGRYPSIIVGHVHAMLRRGRARAASPTTARSSARCSTPASPASACRASTAARA